MCYNVEREGVASARQGVTSQHPDPLCGLACFNSQDSRKLFAVRGVVILQIPSMALALLGFFILEEL